MGTQCTGSNAKTTQGKRKEEELLSKICDLGCLLCFLFCSLSTVSFFLLKGLCAESGSQIPVASCPTPAPLFLMVGF